MFFNAFDFFLFILNYINIFFFWKYIINLFFKHFNCITNWVQWILKFMTDPSSHFTLKIIFILNLFIQNIGWYVNKLNRYFLILFNYNFVDFNLLIFFLLLLFCYKFEHFFTNFFWVLFQYAINWEHFVF